MMIAGYYDITVKYQKKRNGKSYTKTTRYYVVNDGWHYSTSGAYRVEYIKGSYLKSITRLK